MSFNLVQGIDVQSCADVHSAYSIEHNGIYATISAELMENTVTGLLKKLCEPVFFFLEIPCSSDEEKSLRKNKTDPFHYKLYYLDNCTLPVAEAIMKRYGQLLINDGVSQFGFGSHDNGEEIYCRKYQIISVYGEIKKFQSVFDSMKIPEEKNILTLWDFFSNDNPGTSSTVEINGETVNDIAVNLKSEGMYLADTIEEN